MVYSSEPADQCVSAYRVFLKYWHFMNYLVMGDDVCCKLFDPRNSEFRTSAEIVTHYLPAPQISVFLEGLTTVFTFSMKIYVRKVLSTELSGIMSVCVNSKTILMVWVVHLGDPCMRCTHCTLGRNAFKYLF